MTPGSSLFCLLYCILNIGMQLYIKNLEGKQVDEHQAAPNLNVKFPAVAKLVQTQDGIHKQNVALNLGPNSNIQFSTQAEGMDSETLSLIDSKFRTAIQNWYK